MACLAGIIGTFMWHWYPRPPGRWSHMHLICIVNWDRLQFKQISTSGTILPKIGGGFICSLLKSSSYFPKSYCCQFYSCHVLHDDHTHGGSSIEPRGSGPNSSGLSQFGQFQKASCTSSCTRTSSPFHAAGPLKWYIVSKSTTGTLLTGLWCCSKNLPLKQH